ncbi:cap-specific mRNA (nucleoside-2'-O-)-methyltransferase 1-like [Oppia nitens]|uniref:cap-specific mRNA (nucleoside-2'-O-)-methyltransferase 1-like n=1 Tax=Oppia nitens TaxID=1686743 RepID=UPI0023D98F6F|nr:cap-specific mRNA (nucleoside-2'-O-)-methyltransferase 1-like [Oppia nitens]
MAHKHSLKRKSYADFGQKTEDNEEDTVSPKKKSYFGQTNNKLNNNDNETKPVIKSKDNIGKLLMSKMGYKEGQGLGKDSQGNVDVIQESKQKGRRGLGFALTQIKLDPELEWNSDKEKEFASVEENIDWIDECQQPLPTTKELDTFYKVGPKLTSIENETLFCDPEILRNIINCKTVFDSLSGEELRKARSTSNPFETIEKGIFLNRAAMKMANMDAVFDYMFTQPKDESGKSLVKPNELLYFADICSGPGGFSEYVLWRKKWTAKGFGFTLKGPNDFKLDEFFAGSPETFEPHYGDKGLNGNGDIYEPQNLIAFRDFVLRNSDGGVFFVMADGGFSVEGDENNQEILSKRLYLCQFLCSLALLRTNGSFVCKLFDVFSSFSVGLIYLMYRVFKKVSIHKPNSSRPANSERYIICKWKKSGTEAIEHYLFSVNCHLDCLAKEKSTEDIIELVPMDVLKRDQTFLKYIINSNDSIGRRQILFLSKVKAFAENPQLDYSQSELRKECLKYWDVEVKARSAPLRSEPMIRFQELLSKSNEVKDYFAYKPKILEADNVNELDYIHGFKCMVLSAENDYNSCGANSFISVRGFFMGLGRTHIYYWDGSASSKWTKFDAKFELSPSTLIYGEYVQELKGEGKAQKRIAAFHIIDPLFIGGTDVRNKCFEERISMATKFAKAVHKTSQSEYAAIRMKRVYDLQHIHQIFEHMDMKECKSGAQKVRICYEINSDDRFFIPYGLLIVNTVKQPWIVKWSRSQNKLYYFNMKNGTSVYDFPADSLADFRYTFSNRMLWKWESDKYLMSEQIDSKNKLNRYLIENFVSKRL